MHDYHVVTFDHEKAADSLVSDLTTLKVPDFIAYPFESAYAVAVRIPDGVSTADHMAAVKAIALGRGSHNVRFARF